MSSDILVAILAFIGTVIGTFGGILAANKLVQYRLEQLEKKVEKHNNLVERMYNLEKKVAVDEEELEHLKDEVHAHN